MTPKNLITRWSWTALSVFVLTTPGEEVFAADVRSRVETSPIRIAAIEGTVQVMPSGMADWKPGVTNQVLHAGDRIRTGPDSRLALLLSDHSVVRFRELSDFIIEAVPEPAQPARLSLLTGMLYFFHRDQPGSIRVKTRTASALIRGTEFNFEAQENGRAIVTVIEGEVELSTSAGPILLQSNEQGTAEPGKLPAISPVLHTLNIIQWDLYYPAVLDPDDLPWTPAERQPLAESLAAYQRGDLLQALAKYPAGREPSSASEAVYRAALVLGIGSVERAEKMLAAATSAGGGWNGEPPATIARDRRQAIDSASGALRQLIAAVKMENRQLPGPSAPATATEWLAASYEAQSRADLKLALRDAQNAVARSPDFGYARARLAELQFSFGRVQPAKAALDLSLTRAPRNAQALALRGFVLAAQNKIPEAIAAFDESIAVDGALANAWLGRGLCRIHQGERRTGSEDLLMAAALEPQRAVLRSYLAKAYSDQKDPARADTELGRAKGLDPNDPTAWFYSALINQQNNRINEAVRDLEKSQELNDNRRLFRSELLLDQDRAVRSANLANIYRDAGMFDVSVREAARAVNADYANPSAHLFLANSYDQLRDPNFVNLRLEAPANDEYLLANLLSPAGGGVLNPQISQQEYSRLFEGRRLGVASSTDYLSRGAWTESGSQFGTLDNSSYAIGAFYRSDNGQRPNNDVEQRQLFLQLKQQFTAKDSVYLEASQLEIQGGDLTQYYNNLTPFSQLRTKETQQPMLNLGYHHEWSPEHHTLILAGWANDDFQYRNPDQPVLLANHGGGVFHSVTALSMDTEFRDRLDVYTIEPQHIWQLEKHTSIAGARFQFGGFQMQNLQVNPSKLARLFFEPPAAQDFNGDFERESVYAYHQWQILDPLQLVGGVSYDRLRFPENLFAPPISNTSTVEDQVSPKAGFIWTPAPGTTARFAYTRSLGGASLDQSIRIEPAQVAGFNQVFRSVIPESVAGSVPGVSFDTYDVSLEQKLATQTYLGITGEILTSDGDRTVGAFVGTPPPVAPPKPGGPPPKPPAPPPAPASGLPEKLEYQERSILFTLNQLVSDQWALGARYRFTQAELKTDFFEIGDTVAVTGFEPRQDVEAFLHEVNLLALFNHSSGWFSQAEAAWYSQVNQRYTPAREGGDFWQFNVYAGYRFPRRQAEVRLGLLNLTGRDYQLNPLTMYTELPRGRTIAVRVQFHF